MTWHFVWLHKISTCDRNKVDKLLLKYTTTTTAWLRGPAVEHQSLAGVLSPSCARPVADG